MSKRIFSKKQISTLLENRNVVRCSEKAITYNKEFKVRAVRQHVDDGMSAKQIFNQAGFDLDVIGHNKPKGCIKDWLKVFRIRGARGLLVENRGKSKAGGRPRIRGLTDAEKIKRLEATVAYLKAENDFLAKLRAKRAE